ncbi:MAG: anti-sigma factor family protein [Planctomycetota bacterium]|jgi:anti-sigma factor RsiW
MNCDRFEPMILDMVAGELDLEGRRTLRAHLAECKNCRRLLDETDELLETSKSALDEPAPDMRTPAAFTLRSARRARRGLPAWAAAAGIAIAALAGGALGYRAAGGERATPQGPPVVVFADSSPEFWSIPGDFARERRDHQRSSGESSFWQPPLIPPDGGTRSQRSLQ